MADRVAVLKEGRLLQLASPRVLYEQPASRAVAEFVGLSSIIPARVVASNRIDLGFATLAADTGSRTPGCPVFALIRPEHVQADPAEETANRLRGSLGTERYLGSVCRYDFHVPGAETPILAESRSAAQNAIAIAPEHIRLLDQ